METGHWGGLGGERTAEGRDYLRERRAARQNGLKMVLEIHPELALRFPVGPKETELLGLGRTSPLHSPYSTVYL